MFTTIPRYVLLRLLPWFGVCLFGATALTLTAQLLRTASVFAGAGMGAGLQTALLLSVPLTAFAAGPALLVALFITARKMDGDDELLAADALGIGRRRILALLFLFVLAVAGLVGVLWWSAAPSALSTARKKATEKLSAAVVEGITPGRFYRPFSGLTLFAERRGADGTFEKVFIERETRQARFEVAAERASIALQDTAAVLRFAHGRLYYVAQSGAETPDDEAEADVSARQNNRATVTFNTFDLKISFSEALERKLDFLPDLLCRPSSELLASPPPGISPAAWGFAWYRRAAAPVGVFFLGLLGVSAAFGAYPMSRRLGIAAAGIGFVLFHLLGRLGENWALQGRLPPSVGAFAPAILAAVLWVVWTIFVKIVLLRARRPRGDAL